MAQAGLPEDKLRQIRELRDALKLKMKLDECTEEHKRIERENHELMARSQQLLPSYMQRFNVPSGAINS